MKLTVLTVAMILSVPAVWGQKYTKESARGAGPSLNLKSIHTSQKSLKPRAAAPAPAPGVVQVHMDPSTGALTAFFIPTSALPSGTQIDGGISLLDDNSVINFTGYTLSQNFPAGQPIFLPTFSTFGDVYFSQGASFDYTVQVTPRGGATTQADGFVLVGEAYQFSDLASVAPVISSLTPTINSAKDVIIAIKGTFTGDPALVVLSDLFANYVVPAGAITVSSGEIDVDMSKIVGLDLTFSDEFLITVSELGVADTTVFRYVPFAPGTYNLAPTQ